MGTMRELLAGGASILILVISIAMTIYAMIGFFTWIFSDPFDVIEDRERAVEVVEPTPTPYVSIKTRAVEACLNGGGVPIISGWSSNVKRCDFN